MLKLKLQYFGHLMQRADSLEKTLMLGKIEGRRRRGRQRMRRSDGITNSMEMSLSKLRELVMDRRPGMLQSWGCEEPEMTEWPNWNEPKIWPFLHHLSLSYPEKFHLINPSNFDSFRNHLTTNLGMRRSIIQTFFLIFPLFLFLATTVRQGEKNHRNPNQKGRSTTVTACR